MKIAIILLHYTKTSHYEFVKTSFFAMICNIVQMLMLFFLNKAMAVYVGPAGMAIVGQFQNFINITMNVAQGGLMQGVIKYVAEYHEDEANKHTIVGSAIWVVFLLSFSVSVIILIWRKHFSFLVFGSPNYANLLTIYALCLTFFAFNTLFLAVLNGERSVKKYLFATTAGTSLGAILYYFFMKAWLIEGAMVAVVVNFHVLLLVSFPFFYKHSWFRIRLIYHANRQAIFKLFLFSAMAVTSILCTNLSEMIIRKQLITILSLGDAGYWQAMSKLSIVYLGFIITTLTLYYLPRLSAITDKKEFVQEMISCAKTILPIVLIMNITIYLLREPIVQIVFARSFLPMTCLFLFQMIGDFLKIASWMIALVMIAKAMPKLFITTEIIFSCLYVGTTTIAVKMFGLIGASYAWAAMYGLYFLTMFVFLTIFISRSGEKI